MSWPSFGTNRDYVTRARGIETNLATHKELSARFEAEGLNQEQASQKAFQFIKHPVREYTEPAFQALTAGKKENEFLADVPKSLQKYARLAFRMAQRMCPKCHGRLEYTKIDRMRGFRCTGGHMQQGGTYGYDLKDFPKREF